MTHAPESTPSQGATPPDDEAARDDRRHRRALIGCGSVLLLVLIVGGIAGLIAYQRWRSTPDWWNEYQDYAGEVDNATFGRMADDLTARVTEAMSADPNVPDRKAQPTSSKQVFIPVAEVNAWLRVKLEDFLAHKNMRMPSQISRPMVMLRDERIVLAVRVTTPEIDKVMHMWFDARVSDDHMLHVRIEKVYAGELRVPLSTVLKPLEQHPRMREVLTRTDNLRNIEVDPVIEHPGEAAHNLRLVDVAVRDDGLLLTLRTEPQD